MKKKTLLNLLSHVLSLRNNHIVVLWVEKSCSNYRPFLILAEDNFIPSSSLFLEENYVASRTELTNGFPEGLTDSGVLLIYILYINSMIILLPYFHD